MKKIVLSTFIIVVLLVTGFSLAHAAITFTTSVLKATSKATTCVLPSLTATAGQTLIVTTQINSSSTTATIASSPSDTWSTAVHATSTAGAVYVFYAPNVTAGATVATVTLSASATSSCQEAEYANLGTGAILDVTNNSSTAVSSTAMKSGSSTTNFANELLIGSGLASSTAATFTAGTSYTLKATSTIGALEYQIVSSAGSYSTTMTLGTAVGWIDVIATFIGNPVTPGTPTYSSIAATSLTASWTSGANSTYYSLARASSANGTYTQITTTTSLSYSNTGLTGNTSYWYEVNGVNVAGSSTYSASSTQLTLPATPGTPSFSNIATSTLTVTWTAPTGNATYYSLARAPSSNGTYTQITTTTGLTYNDSGLSSNTSYWYEVRGVNATGNGSYSATSTTSTSGPPDATSVSTTTANGGVSGNSITITGTNFGTVSTSNAANCSGTTGTGCVEFIVGGTATVASASITSWSNTSITFVVSSTLASNGGVGALQVWAADASDTTPLNFYIYPNITAVTALGTNAAREYSASDTDGLIMLSGDHFGTSGTSTILGSTATQYGSVAGPCTVGGYTSTSVCLEVPTGIANNNYSGTVILNRSSDNMQATTSLSILPRITGINPSSTAAGTVMQIVGNHFCQTGTCPVTPNRSSTSNNITLGGGGIYSYSRAITVTSNTSIASGTNTSFPMLFSGTYSWLEPVSDGGRIQHLTTAPNGGQEPADLVFATSPSNCGVSNLNFETESYTSSTGAIIDWINVPSESAGTVIYACYGDSGITTDQSNPTATWNINYQAVFHFPNGTTLSTNDSTANGNNGTNNGVGATTGEIGGAGNYTGGQYISLSTPQYYQNATYQAWVYNAGSSNIQDIFGNRYSACGNDQYHAGLDLYLNTYDTSDNNAVVETSNGGTCSNTVVSTANNTVPVSTWSEVTATYSSSTQLVSIYIDGTLSATGTQIMVPQTTYNMNIGEFAGGTGFNYDGDIDEARIVSTALSPSWILTEYNNENSPSSFYTVGSETVGGSTTIPDSSFVNETGGGGVCNGSGAAWSDGEMCATIPLTTATGTIGTTISSNGNISNSYSFTILAAPPGVPGTPTYSSISTSTLTISWTAPSGGATYYSLARATSANGTYSQVTTTTGLSYGDSSLSPSTSYWYEVRGVNGGGNGSYSATSSVTTSANNSPPNAPSQDSPANTLQNISTTPTFLMTATSNDIDSLEYKVTIYSTSGCSSGVVQTDDESSSQTGWSGQNASSSHEYTSGTQGSFTVQSALSGGTQYYWQASAKDPDGSNTWTNSATCNSFSTTSGIWTTDSGNWSILSNALVVTPGSGNYVQLHLTGQNITNDVVEYKVSASGGSTGDTTAILRSDTGSNRYQLGDTDYVDQLDRIGKVISASYSTLVSSSFTLSGSTIYDARGYINGTSLQSWINGSAALSTTDSSLGGSGYIGLAASNNNTFTYDDFAIYTSPIITLSNLPSGGSWSVLDHSGTTINCNTGSTWNASTYTGQIPVDYDNGGGSIAVWTNGTCSGATAAAYPSSGLANDIFGGDTYSYTAGSTGSTGSVASSMTITISSLGLISD